MDAKPIDREDGKPISKPGLRRTVKKGQCVIVGGHKIKVTRGKAHLSFPAGVPVEWEGQKARKA